MALSVDNLKAKLKTELATAAEVSEDDVETIAAALAKAIVEFLEAAAAAGDLDA